MDEAQGVNDTGPPGVTKPLAPEDASDFGGPLLQAVARRLQSAPVPAPGQWLGGLDGHRYEVLAVLGSGGMGRVFRAWDHALHRTVALKFLHAEPGADMPRLLALLRDEAKSIARLDHENIVRIHDVVEWDTGFILAPGEGPLHVPFLVMEALDGECLRSLLRRGRPGPRRSLDILIGVASGLAHAHDRGVVHLDLKPGNVFVLGDGRVKLLDFGLARLISDSAPVTGIPGGGTPAYMAPEQWQGGPLSARTDVWAAGLLFFELLVGEHPFPTAGPEELRARVTSSTPMPSVRERRPELPEALDRLVAEALSLRPEERPADGHALLARLHAQEARLPPPRERTGILVAERWLLTVVSCSLSLVELGDEDILDGEELHALEVGFHSACARIIRQYGGVLATCMGAEVQACFGYPEGREDAAVQAVRAALRLKDALPRELVPLLSGGGVVARVGVHTDLVTVADTAPEPHGLMSAIRGEAPRVAAWLATQAAPDTVLLSEGTHTLVRGVFQTHFLGTRAFAGLLRPTPVGVHQVERERRGGSRFDRALVTGRLTPLIGREGELRRLVALWRGAREGQGTYVLVSGEAGIGKSRLVQELYDRESGHVGTWARCQCWPQLQGSAFSPLVDWLHRFLELVPDEPPTRWRERLEARLGALGMLPEHADPLASFLALPVPQGAQFLQLSVERQREWMMESLATLLLRLAAVAPLTFLLEDVHWADPSTLLFLDVLVGRLEGMPLCVLLTARPEFEPRWADRAGFQLLPLGRLSPACTVDLARAAAGGRPLSEGVVAQLVAHTDGVPLFIEELTWMLLAQGAPEGAWPGEPLKTLPATLHELLQARLDSLPLPLRALVQQAATLGREFRYEMLRALSFLGEDELLRELDALEKAGLLFQQGESYAATYTFRHALVQDVAYQSMPREVRQRHHARVVEMLSLVFPEVFEEQPELLAWHATQAGLVAQAVGLWHDAGHHAEGKSAFPEAISHFSRGLKLLRRLPATHERDQREIALQVGLGMAFISVRGFAAPEVEAVYSRARVLCERFGDVPLSVLWGVWVIALVRGDREGTDRLAVHFERMLETKEDPICQVVVGAALASRAFWRGDLADCQRRCVEAQVPLARRDLQEVPMLIRGGAHSYVIEQRLNVYMYRALSAVVMGLSDQARTEYQKGLVQAEQMHQPYALATVLMFGAAIAHETGDLRAALDDAARTMALSSEYGLPYMLAVSTCLHGWALARLGESERGLDTARQGLAALKAMGAWVVFPLYSEAVGCACMLGGHLQEGLEAVREGMEVADSGLARHALPELWRLRGELLRRSGDERGARTCFLRACKEARAMGALLHELRASLGLGGLLRRVGEEVAARDLVAAVYDRFTEGLDVADCEAARRFLGR
ncbi:protein kinase domain-containing protein [Pyxidicoccus caerfyrddinensis]|uniref:protein kinase domain-containing protein n=1 Tax=Pyxidicoccus caerfyrddinensis TaxID=2709663 RepID=UPI0013D9E997|nr:protein kinase [Pyxidicoccus caerfyrddinensis]